MQDRPRLIRKRWIVAPVVIALPAMAALVGRNGTFGITPAAACTGMPFTQLVPQESAQVPSNAHMFAIGGTGALESVPYPKDMTLLQAGAPVAVQARFIGLAAAELKPTAPLSAGTSYELTAYGSKATFQVEPRTDTTRPRFSVHAGVVIVPPPSPRNSCSAGELLTLGVSVTDDSPTMLLLWVGDTNHPPDLGQAPDWAVLPTNGKIAFRRSFRCQQCSGSPVVGMLAMDVAGNISDEALVLPNRKVASADTFVGKNLPAFADPNAVAAPSLAPVAPKPAESASEPPRPASTPQVAQAPPRYTPTSPASPPRGCGGCTSHGSFGARAGWLLVALAGLKLRRRRRTATL